MFPMSALIQLPKTIPYKDFLCYQKLFKAYFAHIIAYVVSRKNTYDGLRQTYKEYSEDQLAADADYQAALANCFPLKVTDEST